MADMAALAPIAISMGEPAGIGPDLILQLYAERESIELPPFIVVGNMAFLAARARRLGLNINFAATSVDRGRRASSRSRCRCCHIEGLVPDKPGETSPLSGKVVMESIAARRDRDARRRLPRAWSPAPIHKAALYTAGFKYPGHTEYLAALCANGGPAPHAGDDAGARRSARRAAHHPRAAARGAGADHRQADPRHGAHRRARSAHPLRHRASRRLAVTGLNPHAGESGSIGTEDRDIILPAVIDLQHNGIDDRGPVRRRHAVPPAALAEATTR